MQHFTSPSSERLSSQLLPAAESGLCGWRWPFAGSRRLVGGALFCLSLLVPALLRAQTTPSYTICAEGLNGQWSDWSWNTQSRYNQPTPDGSRGLAVQYTAGGGGLYLHANAPISLTGFTDLKLWVYGESPVQPIRVFLNNSEPVYTFTPTANQWTLLVIPLLTFGNPTSLSDLYFQDAAETNPMSVWYAKAIYLEGNQDEELPETDVIVSPNPVESGQGQVTLRLRGFLADETVFVTLTDLYGRTLRQNAVVLSSVEMPFAVTGLAAGVYFIGVMNERSRHVRKIVLK